MNKSFGINKLEKLEYKEYLEFLIELFGKQYIIEDKIFYKDLKKEGLTN